MFDVGGILVGCIFDHLDAQALTTASFTFSAIPSLFFYDIYRNISLAWSIALMFSIGRPMNGSLHADHDSCVHCAATLAFQAFQRHLAGYHSPVSLTGSRNEGHRRTWATVCGLGL
jgi:hypothetical protein